MRVSSLQALNMWTPVQSVSELLVPIVYKLFLVNSTIKSIYSLHDFNSIMSNSSFLNWQL